MWELADATGAASPNALLGEVGWISAALSLCLAFIGVVGRAPLPANGPSPLAERHGIRFAWSAALLLAIPPTVLVMVAVVGRTIRIAIALLVAGPASMEAAPNDGTLLSDRTGLAITIMLSASVLVALRGRRDDRLPAVQLWSLVLVATWAWSSVPTFTRTPSGALVRTPMTLWLMVALSAIVMGSWWITRVGRRTEGLEPTRANLVPVRSICVLVFSTSILICYHLAVPIRVPPGGFRTGMILVGACGMAGAVSALGLCRIRWYSHLAESAMVAGSLGLCAACAIAIPDEPVTIAGRMPTVFVAVVIGLACGSLIWTSVSRRLRRGASLPGVPTPLGDLLRPLVIRSAFYCAAAAALVSAIMAVWPRFAGVAVHDDSLGRFATGIAADLWLLLVLVVGIRHERRPTFHLLALLTLISTGAFVAVRLWPYAHKVGQTALP